MSYGYLTIGINFQELSSLEKRQDTLNKEIESLGQKRENFQEKEENLKPEQKSIQKKIDDQKQNKLALEEERERTLSESSENLGRFGKEFPMLVKDIEKCKKFSKKPIGPVGR